MFALKNIKILIMIPAALLFVQIYGCSERMQPAETVKPESPVAIVKASPRFGAAPLTVKFNGSGSRINGEGELSYLWDFDDGIREEGSTTEHEFKAVGTYMVTLTVKDNSGKYDTAWVTIIVN